MKTLNKFAFVLIFVGLSISTTGQTVNCGSISPTVLSNGLSSSPCSGVGSGTFYNVTLSGNWNVKKNNTDLSAINIGITVPAGMTLTIHGSTLALSANSYIKVNSGGS